MIRFCAPRSVLYGPAFLSGFVFVLVAAAVEAGEPRALDLHEVRAQWAAARASAARYSGVVEGKERYLIRPRPQALDADYRWEMKQNKDCASVFMSGGDFAKSKGCDFVVGVNPKYAFQIKRTLGKNEWALDQIEMGADGSQLPMAFGLPKGELPQRWVCDHFSVFEHRLTLEKLFEKPNFKVTRTEAVSFGGSELVRVEFECPSGVPAFGTKDDRYHPVQGGHLILDPNSRWCTKEYEVRIASNASGKFTARFEYADDREHFPVLSAARKRAIYPKNGKDYIDHEITWALDLHESAGQYEDREFALSNYGLPEPVGVSWVRPTPSYVWLFCGAGVLGMLSLGLRYAARRNRKAAE